MPGLTIAAAKAARAADRAYKLSDEKGLYLFVTPTGTKSWRMKYRYAGKEKALTFGLFPEVSLSEARDRRDDARLLLRRGTDPKAERDRNRCEVTAAVNATFEASALQWHEDEAPRWSPRHAGVVLSALRRDVFPAIGKKPISYVDGPMVLEALRSIERRGSVESAKRVLGYIRSIFIRAKAERLIDENPTADLIHALKPTPRGGKQPAITSVPGLMKLQIVVDNSTANPATKLASRLLALTAVRVGVLRTGRWENIHGVDWSDPNGTIDNATWRIPATEMKLATENKFDDAYSHDVPLASAAVDVLRNLRRLSGKTELLFPSDRSGNVPMSDPALSSLYARIDGGRYQGRMVPHGWRSAFSTLMNEWAMEHGRDGDRLLIDLMLSHRPSGMSGAEFAYNVSVV